MCDQKTILRLQLKSTLQFAMTDKEMLTSDQTETNTNMELLNTKDNAKTEIITYRFSVNEEKMATTPEVSARFRQIIPTVCASLTCIPFGLMLGWPSPTNPILIEKDSPIPISIDQSAMIAGALMLGNSVGTQFCNRSILGSKFSILIGITVMSAGWILMWQSQNIFWLLGSRFLVGLGHGYVLEQIKIYIKNTCDEDLKICFTKMINLHTAIVSLLISLVITFLLLFLPTTPNESVRADKVKSARNVISKLKHDVNVNSEIRKINDSNGNKDEEYGLVKLIRDQIARDNFFKFSLLVFFQQFTGAPSTIIYTQILFAKFHCPYPQYLAIAYVAVYFVSNVVGIFLMPKFNKRLVLLLSTGIVILLTAAQILVVYFDLNDKYCNYSSVVVLFLFIIVHTLGLGNIPVTMIADLFPSFYRTSVTHFFIVLHSISALVVTKIFQVLLTVFNVGAPFYFFLAVSCFAFLFIYFFIRIKTDRKVAVSVEHDVEINHEPVS